MHRNAVVQRGRCYRERQKRLGKVEHHEADHRERGGGPQRLTRLLADLVSLAMFNTVGDIERLVEVIRTGLKTITLAAATEAE